MPISVECPACGRKYTVADRSAARTLPCKQCGGSIPLPEQWSPVESAPMLRFSCDQCGKHHMISAEHAGMKTLCVKCGAKIRIPGGSQSTVSARSASAPASSTSKSAKAPASARESAPAGGLDLYGLEDGPAAPLPRSAGRPAEASASGGSAGEDDLPPPARLNYGPLSEAKKKQIARRAAKADRMKPSNATLGVSFGTVLAIALIGWRFYRILNRFERAAARENAVQAATAEDFDPRVILVEMDKAVEKMVAAPSTAEARGWLDAAKYPNHGVMEMSTDKAREMVAGFYERGAAKVFVLDPSTIGNSVITAQFAVKLPQDSAQRKRCLEWAAKYEEDGSPSPDNGQKYLLISTD